MLNITEAPHEDEIYLLFQDRATGIWYVISRAGGGVEGAYWNLVHPQNIQRPALILPRRPHNLGDVDTVTKGLFVSVEDPAGTSNEGVNYCQTLDTIIIVRLGEGAEANIRHSRLLGSPDHTSSARAETCAESQKWCVG